MKPRHRRIAVLGPVLLALCLAPAALTPAHPYHGSFTTVLLDPGSLQVEVRFNLEDLDRAFSLDQDLDGCIGGAELLARVPAIYAFVEDRLVLEVDGRRLELERWGEEELLRRVTDLVPEDGFEPDHLVTVFLGFVFRNRLQEPPHTVAVSLPIFDRLGDEHRNIVRFAEQVDTGYAQEHVILDVDRTHWEFRTRAGTSPAPADEAVR